MPSKAQWILKKKLLCYSNMSVHMVQEAYVYIYIYIYILYIYIYTSTNIKIMPTTNWLQGGKKRAFILPDQTLRLTCKAVRVLTVVEMGHLNRWPRKMITKVKQYKPKNSTSVYVTSRRKILTVTLPDQTLLLICWFVCVEVLLWKWCDLTIDFENDQ